jgi:hypothetical protein
VTVGIPLNSRKHKGFIAIVDDIDADLGGLKWHPTIASHTTYAQRRPRIREKSIPMHRVVLERVLGRALVKGEEVDHKNRNGLDNRRENLRLASRLQNVRNRSIPGNNGSGYKGVSWDKRIEKWYAYITFNYKMKALGRFADIKDAARAYNRAALEYHGEFAYQNVIPEDD